MIQQLNHYIRLRLAKWTRRLLPSDDPEGVLRISSDSRVSLHEHGVVLLNVKSGVVYVGNGVAGEILTWVMNRSRGSEIAARVSKKYDIPPERAIADTTDFITQMRGLGLVTLCKEVAA